MEIPAAPKRGTPTPKATAFLPETHSSRTASTARQVISGRLITTAVTTPGAYDRNTIAAGTCGTNTFASIVTINPNNRYAQKLCGPRRELKCVITNAATV